LSGDMDANIVLLGPPGSGKGTQASRLSKTLGLTHISTGDLLREAIGLGTPLGIKAKEYVESGRLVPDELVVELIKEKVGGAGDGVLLDGFPRNLEQARMLEEIVKIDAVINIDIEEGELVRRLTQRRTCKSCKAVYNLDSNPPVMNGKCDRCGGDLIQRSDDTEQVVKERLKVYRESTLPLTEHYQRKKILIDIDGKGTIEEVYQRTMRSLEPLR